MMKAFTVVVLMTTTLIAGNLCAQSNPELAVEKAKQAIALEDKEGKYDEAIKLFEESQKLDPDNINYPYELAYAYTQKKDYKKAADILEKLLKHKQVNGRVYQALGNAYDYQGKSEKAMDTYQKGIEHFPNAGELYLEMGNMKIANKDYEAALKHYEKGIEMNPKFPSNYYWATKIYCNSSEEVWGMLYGELFMNLERNSPRTAEISQLLFDTYKTEISFTSDTSYGVSFSKVSSMSIGDLKDPKKFKLPFGTGCYEMLLSIAVAGETSIDINSLDRIRTRFLDLYFKSDYPAKYPNILFDFQQEINKEGHLEAYNHWILMKGDEDKFIEWQNENGAKWNAFLTWFRENMLQVNLQHRFYTGQY